MINSMLVLDRPKKKPESSTGLTYKNFQPGQPVNRIQLTPHLHQALKLLATKAKRNPTSNRSAKLSPLLCTRARVPTLYLCRFGEWIWWLQTFGRPIWWVFTPYPCELEVKTSFVLEHHVFDWLVLWSPCISRSVAERGQDLVSRAR